MAFGQLLVRRRDGRWELRLSANEREALSEMADDLESLLTEEPDHPNLRRLFPPAYPDDVANEAEWQVFKAAELRESRTAQLAVLRGTTRRHVLEEDELMAWMQAVNSLRIVVGTRLGLEDDEDERNITPDDPNYREYLLFDALGFLVGMTVEAISRSSS